MTKVNCAYGPGAVLLIPTCNRLASLKETLQSLAGCEQLYALHELVIVNNGQLIDNEPIKALASGIVQNVTVLHEPRAGVAYAFNCGLEHICATHPPERLLLKIDDDVNPAEQWLKAMLEATAQWGKASILGGRIKPVFPVNSAMPRYLPKASFSVLYSEYDFGEQTHSIHRAAFGPNMGWRVGLTKHLRCKTDLELPNYIGEETQLVSDMKALSDGVYVYIAEASVEHRIREEQLEKTWIHNRYFKFGRTGTKIYALDNPDIGPDKLELGHHRNQLKYRRYLIRSWLLRILMLPAQAQWYRLKAERARGESHEYLHILQNKKHT